MITLLTIRGEQGKGKTFLANIIRELNKNEVLIIDDMSDTDVKVALTKVESKISLLISTTINNSPARFTKESTRRIQNFIEVTL